MTLKPLPGQGAGEEGSLTRHGLADPITDNGHVGSGSSIEQMHGDQMPFIFPFTGGGFGVPAETRPKVFRLWFQFSQAPPGALARP